jgi:glycine betaine/proline transport system substrate-binding protein
MIAGLVQEIHGGDQGCDLKKVQIAWSNSLKERSPAIAEFFERFSLTADDVSTFAYEISGKGRDPA